MTTNTKKPTFATVQVEADVAPQSLLDALSSHRGKFTQARNLYHCINFDMDSWCGVFGDGAWANYEWYVWRQGRLEASDVGYGIIEVALRDVLNHVLPK